MKPPVICLSLEMKVVIVNVFDVVGNTPIFALRRIWQEERGITIFGKAEFMNPSGSVKDRAAKAMLLSGLKDGTLKPGMEILDATSGSTGIAYCMMAAQIGCSVSLCMPANVSRKRKQLIAAYGGRIIETSPLEGPEGALTEARHLVQTHPGRYFKLLLSKLWKKDFFCGIMRTVSVILEEFLFVSRKSFLYGESIL